MPAPKPERYWRAYGTDPLPTGAEAMDEPFAAFPSWLLSTAADRATKAPAQRQAVQAVQPVPSPHRSPPAPSPCPITRGFRRGRAYR